MASIHWVTDVDADGLPDALFRETTRSARSSLPRRLPFLEKVRDRPADAGSLRNGLRPGAHSLRTGATTEEALAFRPLAPGARGAPENWIPRMRT